jgi:hypothetical protein
MSAAGVALRPVEMTRSTAGELIAFMLAYFELIWAFHERDGEEGRAGPASVLRFRELGISDSVPLWLLFHGHVEHFMSRRGKSSPVQAKSLVFTDASCFALTAVGKEFAEHFLAEILLPTGDREFDAAWDKLMMGQLTPRFSLDTRILQWGIFVLKRFLQPSANQELVLATAEELGWPSRFDDPLPMKAGTNPKVRLHDTIKCLNRHQTPHLIQFGGDGTGRRVGWDYR